MPTRHRISLALETLLWIAVLAMLVWLVLDVRQGVGSALMVCGQNSLHWAKGCPDELPWRSIVEFFLIGLLVFWPLFRTRIRYGYWMRDWQDDPVRHARETGRSTGVAR